MAKLSSLKIKMGQMQYEKQRKEHKLQAAKVGFPQDAFSACHMIMVFDLSLQPPLSSFFFFKEGKKELASCCVFLFFFCLHLSLQLPLFSQLS